MFKQISSIGSSCALVLSGAMLIAGTAGAEYPRGEWRGAWEAVPSAAPLADQFFRVEYTATTRGADQAEISGYVYNVYGLAAENVQLEVTDLDASGQPIARETRPVYGLVPAEGRAYFDVTVPRSDAYRVAVRGFDFVEEGSNHGG
jgi:hypothetical protein